jgi:hypothetical protein
MSSEASADTAHLGTLDLRRRQLLARIAYGAGLASALSALSACGGGGPDDATLRAVDTTMDIASIDVQFNNWLSAGVVVYGGAASSYARRNLWSVARWDISKFGVRNPGPPFCAPRRRYPRATQRAFGHGQSDCGA